MIFCVNSVIWPELCKVSQHYDSQILVKLNVRQHYEDCKS